MKVAANGTRALAALASTSSAGFPTRSILLTRRILGCATAIRRSRTASVSSSMPRLASMMRATMSASCAPAQALVTMARSSRRLGANMPGVSTRTSCAAPSVAMPRRSVRVVCTLCETMATLLPTRALISVDLPTLGAPISATKPQRLPEASPVGTSAIEAARLDAGAREHGGGGRLLGGALRAAKPFGRHLIRQFDGDAELRVVIGPLALDFAVGRRRQSARLRPFRQHRLGVAQRPRRRAHARLPQPLDQRHRRRIAAIDKYRADQRLADIGQNGGAAAAAGIGL